MELDEQVRRDLTDIIRTHATPKDSQAGIVISGSNNTIIFTCACMRVDKEANRDPPT